MPLSLPDTVITIDGATYSSAQQATAGIHVDSWSWDYDGDLEAEFHEAGPWTTTIGRPRWKAGDAVVVACDGANKFKGEIASVHPTFDEQTGWRFAYHCRGPKYQANLLYVTSSGGDGRLAYNLSPRDEDYVASLAGQTVGQIVGHVLTTHAAALTALGIATDATTTTQLGAMDVVPPEPVRLSGRLWNAIDSVLRQWQRTFASFIGADGKVRFIDTTTGTTVTLTEGTDPLDPFRFGYSLEDVATRVRVRGRAKVFPFYASVLKTTLTPAWSGTDQTNWALDDFEAPGDAVSDGAVTSILSSTSVRIDPANAGEARSANFWSDRQAWVYLEKSAGTGLTFSEQVPVTASTAYSAGGTCDLTLAWALENSGAGAYDQYKLIGRAGALSGGVTSLVDVWRLYDVTDAGGLVADHLQRSFPVPVPFVGYYRDAQADTLYPIGVVVDANGSAFPVTFTIVPQTGQVRFDRPVVEPINTRAALQAGGAAVTAPDDVYVLLAYARGALEAVHPPDSGGSPVFDGDAFDLFGLERTMTIDLDSWVYEGDRAKLTAYAEMIHASVSVPTIDHTIAVRGYHSAADATGRRLNLASAELTTGWESLAAPIRGFRLQYHVDAAGGVLHTSHVRVSTRRNPRTGDRLYVHPRTFDDLRFKLPAGGGLNLAQFASPGGFTSFGALAAGIVGAFDAARAAAGSANPASIVDAFERTRDQSL